MGRELRRVPADWEHPKCSDGRGSYQPKFDESYREAAENWMEGLRAFEPTPGCPYYWEWSGPPPDEAYYRPEWTEEERTHFQMYETCSEGSPISPVLATPEAVARWCADNEASAFGSMTQDYEAWLRICAGDAFGLLLIDSKGMRPDATVEREVPSE